MTNVSLKYEVPTLCLSDFMKNSFNLVEVNGVTGIHLIGDHL
jgi:hypothetical protein